MLLGLALPIRIPVTIGSQDGNLLVPLYVVILLGLVAWIWGRVRAGASRAPAPEGPPALNVPLAAFVGFLLVSTLWSADPAEAAEKAVVLLHPLHPALRPDRGLVAARRGRWPRWPSRRSRARPCAGLVGLWQYASHEIWWNETLQQANVYSRFFRVNGIFFDPNILGRYLVVGILVVPRARLGAHPRPASWCCSRRPRRSWRARLVVTFSRSSALMLMVGLVLLAVRAVRARGGRWSAGAVLLVLGRAASRSPPAATCATPLTDSDRLERVSEGRFDLMRAGSTIWREEPGGRRRAWAASRRASRRRSRPWSSAACAW